MSFEDKFGFHHPIFKLGVYLSFGFLVFFFYYPLAMISIEAMKSAYGPLYHFTRIITKKTTILALNFTIVQAILSTILSIVFGLPIAYIFTKYKFVGKSTIRSSIIVPFILPGIVVGLGFLFLFGENGFFPSFFSEILGFQLDRYQWAYIGIIFAHAYYNSPLVVILTESLWRRMDPEIEEAAEIMGVHGFKKFYKITLPHIMPGILTSGILTFIFSFTSFEVVLLLGGFRYRTLEVEIYRLFTSFLDFSGAAALSLLQLLLTILMTLIYIHYLNKYADVKKAAKTEVYPEKELFVARLENVALILLLFAFLVFEIFPIVLIFTYSIIDPVNDVFTLSGYLEFLSTRYNPYLGSPPILAPLNTLFFSTITAIVALTMGLLTAYFIYTEKAKASLSTILMILPLATSKITLAIGLILAFGSLHFIYADPRILIVASHIIIAYPFSTRSNYNGLLKIDPDIIEAAEVLGADPSKRFIRVDLPLLSPSLAVSLSLSFAVSLGEFAATNILYGGHFPTITVAIFVFLGGRRFTASAAGASILVLMSLIIFYIVSRYSEDLSGGFS